MYKRNSIGTVNTSISTTDYTPLYEFLILSCGAFEQMTILILTHFISFDKLVK